MAKCKEPISGRSALILLALIAGAAVGAIVAIHAPRFAPLVPLGVLAFVLVCVA